MHGSNLSLCNKEPALGALSWFFMAQDSNDEGSVQAGWPGTEGGRTEGAGGGRAGGSDHQ